MSLLDLSERLLYFQLNRAKVPISAVPVHWPAGPRDGFHIDVNAVSQDLEIQFEENPADKIYSAVGILTFGISTIPDQVRFLLGSTENRPRK